MTFDYEAYEKVFPAQPTPTATIDSAVEGYTPTADEASGKPNEADLNTVPAQTQPKNGANLPTQPAQPINATTPPVQGKTDDMGANQPPQGTQPINGGKGE